MTSISRLFRTPLLAAAAAVLFLHGCYYFVQDETPPEWQGDPAADAQNVGAIAAGTGGPGQSVYNGKCAVCHQMDGKGLPGVYPPLGGSAFATGDPIVSIRIVLNGFHGPIQRDGKNYNGVMQPWRNDLDDQQIADVLTYVRSSFGNSAPAVDAAKVKEIRDATASKVGAYTEDELKSAL